MDAQVEAQVEAIANALRTLPFQEATNLMADILKAFFIHNATSPEKLDEFYSLLAGLEGREHQDVIAGDDESIQPLMQSAKSKYSPLPTLEMVQLILYRIESYLLEYLADEKPAAQFSSSNNTEHTITIDDDDDGVSVERFEFPTKVCDVIYAIKVRRLTTSTSPSLIVADLAPSSSPI